MASRETNQCPTCKGSGLQEYTTTDRRKQMTPCSRCDGSGRLYTGMFIERRRKEPSDGTVRTE